MELVGLWFDRDDVLLSLSLPLFPVFPPFGCPMVPPLGFLSLSFFSVLCLSGAPPSNVGFINVNIVKYLRRYFNIETGTLFV